MPQFAASSRPATSTLACVHPATLACRIRLSFIDGHVRAQLQTYSSSLSGSTKEKRARTLWTELEALYEKLKFPACRRRKKLTLKDIVKPGKAPDLDAKAAEVRGVCTLALEPLPAEFDGSQLVASGEKFISQYMALEKEAIFHDEEDTSTCRAKPNLHLLGHILDEAREGHNPQDTWNYRDETAAFQFQQLFYTRGGNPKPGHQTEKYLLKWAAERFFRFKEQPA